MSNHQLTAGVCARLQGDSLEESDVFDTHSIVQVLSIKKVGPSPNAAADRYRMIMSDGINFVQAMLGTGLNDLVASNGVGKHTIVRLTRTTCNYVQEKRLIIVLDMEVVANDAPKIGEPVALNLPDAGGQTPSTSSTTTPAPQFTESVQRRAAPAAKAPRQGSVFPIEGLSPYQNNWTIKARVTQKSDIKTWSNQRGEGKLFSVNLMDESAEIKGTAFNSVAEDLYPKLEEGKVYYISKARVNLAKKKFSNIPNDYELSFERNTQIEECHDTANVPKVKYDFVSLGDLESRPKDSTCDVLAIVQEVGPLGEINSKAGRTIPKRELTLVDRSGYSVRLTLWGKQAEQYTTEGTPVIAFKGVKIGDFGGRSLSMFSGSTMVIDPQDVEGAFELQGWYDSTGSGETFQSHTMSSSSGGGAGAFNRTEMRNLNDVKESQLGMDSSRVDHFSTRATIMHIKSENISYPACPTERCNKKVIQDGDGWRCESCNQTYPNPEHRYIISFAVADWSGQAWLQGFNDVGLTVFGKTANELVAIRERDESAYTALMQKATCQTYNFACRAKQDTYNDQTRVRYGITRILPLDYKEEATMLRDLLRTPWAL
ncbi:hypothetical protein HGRIS_012973 [Hohenbuehelia grisea]|uniref:Replication protein A subunit n=1 Tax=Hohenbuehelia grisea TaxID=104357 RepID=A0ABR3IU24_9AGAR